MGYAYGENMDRLPRVCRRRLDRGRRTNLTRERGWGSGAAGWRPSSSRSRTTTSWGARCFACRGCERAADAQSGCAHDMKGRPERGHGEPFRWIVQQGAGGFSRCRIPYTLCIFICYYIANFACWIVIRQEFVLTSDGVHLVLTKKTYLMTLSL
jgi:hypothetical protein